VKEPKQWYECRQYRHPTRLNSQFAHFGSSQPGPRSAETWPLSEAERGPRGSDLVHVDAPHHHAGWRGRKYSSINAFWCSVLSTYARMQIMFGAGLPLRWSAVDPASCADRQSGHPRNGRTRTSPPRTQRHANEDGPPPSNDPPLMPQSFKKNTP